MFGSFFNTNPTIVESGSFYTISGIHLRTLEADLRSVFGTSVLASKMLKPVNSSKFRIHKFFLVEFIYILDYLVNKQSPAMQRYYRVGLPTYSYLYKEIKENTWVKTTFQDYPPMDINKGLEGFAFSPFPDQRRFLEDYNGLCQGFQLRGTLLDSPPGSGKTPTSLFWMRIYGKYKKIVIVPKHLVEDPWEDHLSPKGKRYCFKTPPTYWTSKDKEKNPLNVDVEFYIFYTENIRKDSWNDITFDTILKTLSRGGKEPLVLTVDEAHRYNEVDSQQTQGFIAFGSSPYISDVLSMTGTPIKALGRETYPLFCVIDPYFDRHVRADFLKLYGRNNVFLNELLAHRLGRVRFTIPVIEGMGPPPVPEKIAVSFPGCEQFTLSNIRLAMTAYIQERVVYYRKHYPIYEYDFNQYLKQYEQSVQGNKQALIELAEYRGNIAYFKANGYNNFTDAPLSKFCKMIEKKIEADLKGESLHYFRFIAPVIKYVGLKIRGEALGNVLGKARMEAIKATIRHSNLPMYINGAKKKTAIYTSYVPSIKETETYLIEEGFRPVTFYGETKEGLPNILAAMENSPDVNPIITTFDSLSEGTPLLFCNQLILLNSPWRDFSLKQVIARIHRKGQTEQCFVWIVDLDTGNEDNITSRSIDIMEYYKDIVDQLLSGGNLGDIGGATTKGITKGWEIDDVIPDVLSNVSFVTNFVKKKLSALF